MIETAKFIFEDLKPYFGAVQVANEIRVARFTYPLTPEGQAGFYSDCIPRLAKHPFVIGTFIYCWGDDAYCYVCGQPDCPTETQWGLVDAQGHPKPAFYAVKEAYGKLM